MSRRWLRELSDVQATVGDLKASYWTVTVSPKAQPSPFRLRLPRRCAAAPAAAREAEPVTAARAEASAAENEPSAPLRLRPPRLPAGRSPVAGACDESTGAGSGCAGLRHRWWRRLPTGGSGEGTAGCLPGTFLESGDAGGWVCLHLQLSPVSRRAGRKQPRRDAFSNQAVRVVQTIGNQNFDVAIKIDSPLFATDANTSQGLMVVSDDRNFITFALQTDGTKVGLSAHTVAGGVATSVLQDSDFSQYQNPMYLRLTKTGSAYVALYSIDGINFTQAASFTDTAPPTAIGPFASNHNDTPANAVPVVMSVNWFDVQQ